MKKFKWQVLLSSIVVLLPILFGVLFWDMLPEQMSTHWGANGEVDGWTSKGATVFLFPAILLLVHLSGILLMKWEIKKQKKKEKMLSVMLWIVPVLSLVVNGSIYSISFEKELSFLRLIPMLMGVLFVVVGNYLPKCEHSYTMGIKVKWALEDEENWYATHRFGGKVWMIGGLLILCCGFLPEEWAMVPFFVMVLVMVVLPIVYSYLFYRKQVREGRPFVIPRTENPFQNPKKYTRLITVVALIFVAVIMFTGNVGVAFEDTSFTVKATLWQDLTVEYDAIDRVELVDKVDVGTRTNGVGSARLSVGMFRNDAYGSYTLYSYTKCDSAVVLNVDGKILVINGMDEESTKEIYEEIKERVH